MLNKYLIGASAIALTFSLNIGSVGATCPVIPTCAELGYNKTNCGDFESLKCPFDKTKLKCLEDPCIGYYPSSENGGCYPGIGNVVYCPADSSKCKYTRCYDYFYDSPSNGAIEGGVFLQDGKCVSGDSLTGSGNGCFYLKDIPYSVKNDPFIDLSQSCGGNLIKPTCKLGTYWYGKCYLSGIHVGDYLFADNGSYTKYTAQNCTGSCVGNTVFEYGYDSNTLKGGVVFDVSDSYIKIFQMLPASTCLGTQGAPYHGDGYTPYTQLSDAKADMSGYDNTAELINNNNYITFMNNLNSFCYSFHGSFAKCYLASVGELDLAVSRVWNQLAETFGSTMGEKYLTSNMASNNDVLWYYNGGVSGASGFSQIDTLSLSNSSSFHCAFVILIGNDSSQSGGDTGGDRTGTILQLDGANIGYVVEETDSYVKFAALTDFNGTYFGNCASSGGYSCDISGPALSDFNGYENTENILATNTSCTSDSCPFYKATHYTPSGVGSEYNALVSSGKIHWYVPALGELMMLEDFFFSTEAVNANYYSSCNDSSYYMTSTGEHIVTARTSSSSCYDTRTFENTQYYAGKIIPFGIITK